MTLRDRCEALVREWGAGGGTWESDELQAALDATEGEALDAARYRLIRSCHDSKHKPVAVVVWGDEPWEPETGELLDAAIDAAMKESKP
jgi:hypothetical protein